MDMVKTAKPESAVARRGRPRKPAEQQRALETRGAILNAAIAEFAERGFEGARDRRSAWQIRAGKLRFAATCPVA
jgi:TetR/AcrR family transcriptional regulator